MLIALLTIFSLCAPAFSADTMADSADWEGFNKNLQLSAPGTTLNDWIATLPDDYFAYDTLTYVTNSRSPEAALVNELSPRVILFGKSAKIIIAFEDQTATPHLDEARVIHNNNGEFDFFELKFSKNKPQLIKEENNRCFRCHHGKPIWSDYRNWQGTFGAKSDLQWVPEDVGGYFSFLNFTKHQSTSPRYQRTVSAIGQDNHQPPITDLLPHIPEFQPRKPYAPGEGFFLSALESPISTHLVHQLKKSKTYKNNRALLTSLFIDCPSKASTHLSKSVLPKIFDKSALATLADANNIAFSKTIKTLELVGRAMGVSDEHWASSFEVSEPPMNYDTSTFAGGFQLGGGVTMADHIIRVLIEDLKSVYPELKNAFDPVRWSDPYYTYLDPRYQDRIPKPFPQDFKLECAALGKIVDDEYNSHGIHFDPSELVERGRTSLKVQCLSCHAGEHPKAPIIPFSNAHDFKIWSQDYDKKHGEHAALQKITKLIKNKRMPPDRSLNNAQQEALLREFTSWMQ